MSHDVAHLFSITNGYKNWPMISISISSILAVIMASKIKLFSYVKFFSARIGINPPEQCQKILFSSKNAFLLIFNTQIIVLMLISCATAATSVFEQALSFYLCTTSIVATSVYILYIVQYSRILKLIDEFEQIVEQSK